MKNGENLKPYCWIRGDMSASDLKDDPVRQVTQKCHYRTPRRRRVYLVIGNISALTQQLFLNKKRFRFYKVVGL